MKTKNTFKINGFVLTVKKPIFFKITLVPAELPSLKIVKNIILLRKNVKFVKTIINYPIINYLVLKMIKELSIV